MTGAANYDCPDCDGQLYDAGASNAWRCRKCGKRVLEAISTSGRKVRQFYRRATERRWGGLRG